MRRFFVSMAAVAVVLPVLAYAALDTTHIDFTDVTGRYGDAPFSKAETAAISVLTTMGVVEGNPDGTFAPKRTLNRAEFTKIALSLKNIEITSADKADCFPDVHTDDWFSGYVCKAKTMDVVQGYTDGNFRPAQSVTYAEAVKILSALFDYSLSPQDGDEWFSPYMRAAQDRGVLIGGSILPHDFITRGQMARLAAAVGAEKLGRLADYRLAERGQWTGESTSGGSMSSVQTGTGSSVMSSGTVTQGSAGSNGSAVSTTSSSNGSLPSFGQVSSSSSSQKPGFQFLYTGQPTPPIYTITVKNAETDVRLSSAEFKLWSDMDSIKSLYLVDESGVTVGALTLIVLDVDHDGTDEFNTWRGTFGSGATIPKNTPRTYQLRAQMDEGDQLIAGEVFDPRYLALYGQAPSGQSKQMTVVSEEKLRHIAVKGAVTGVRNTLDDEGTIQPGANKLLAMYTFTGTGTNTAVEEVEVRAKLVDVSLTHMTIGDDLNRGDCSSSGSDRTLFTCIVPTSIAKVAGSPRSYSVRADVATSVSGKNPTAQLTIEKAGAIDSTGSVRWTDGSWHYRLLQSSSPVAEGPLWHVVP